MGNAVSPQSTYARRYRCVCFSCQRVFQSQADRVEHQCPLVDVALQSARCPLCFVRFGGRRKHARLFRHLQTLCVQVDRPVALPAKVRAPFRCKRCGQRAVSPAALRAHRKKCGAGAKRN